MFELKILDKSKKKTILNELENYGIGKLNYLFLRTNSKLRIFSGLISKDELLAWMRDIRVDNIGLYFASLENGLRMSLDAVHLLAAQVSKNILEIDDIQAEKWFHGHELSIDELKKTCELDGLKEGFIIIKNKGDFIGVGKLSRTKILNFMPKERRIKN